MAGRPYSGMAMTLRRIEPTKSTVRIEGEEGREGAVILGGKGGGQRGGKRAGEGDPAWWA